MNETDGGRVIVHDDVTRLCRDISDAKTTAILATGATLEELEEAVAWAEGESDVMGEERHPLEGRVAQIYEIIVEGEDLWEDDRPGG